MNKYIAFTITISLAALIISYLALNQNKPEKIEVVNQPTQNMYGNYPTQVKDEVQPQVDVVPEYRKAPYLLDNDGSVYLKEEKIGDLSNYPLPNELEFGFSYKGKQYYWESVNRVWSGETTGKMYIYEPNATELKVSKVGYRNWLGAGANLESKFYGIGQADSNKETRTIMEYDAETDSEKVFYTLPSGYSFTKSVFGPQKDPIVFLESNYGNEFHSGVYSTSVPLHNCGIWDVEGCLERSPIYQFRYGFGQ